MSPTGRLEQLVGAHQREVWRYLRFLGAGSAEASDLTQETFLEVWRRPFEDQGERAGVGYLREVARNRLLKGLREGGRKPAVVDLDAAEELWTGFAGEDGGDGRIEALRRCLEELDEQGQTAIDLRYHQGLGRQAMADELGMELEEVKSLLRRLRDSLKECAERRLQAEDR